MKESYHICFTSHDEVLFRDEEDHGVFVNLMALRAFSSEAEILADAEMSTHFHSVVFAENPMLFASALRMSYTKYFNQKYDRKGRMGQKYTFSQKIDGFYHLMVALSYVLRNGLHHGAAPTALGYAYCSVRELFAKEIGLFSEKAGPFSRADMGTTPGRAVLCFGTKLSLSDEPAYGRKLERSPAEGQYRPARHPIHD